MSMELRHHRAVAALAVFAALAGAETAQAQRFSDWSAPTNLGPVVNTASTDGCPFVSKDGLSLYFASNRPGGAGGLDIYVSQRASVEDPWAPPQSLGPAVNTGSNELCPTLTVDGHFLYFVSDRPGGCGGQDLYVSRRHNKREDFGWQAPLTLGCEVNSAANDFSPSYVEDDDTGVIALYFSSNRPGGPGGTDIYASVLGEDETFGPAGLVEELSTPFNDQRPNLHHDGKEIFIDSDRPGSLGFDLWLATRSSGWEPWSEPVNLGTIVNSAALEGRPAISFRGTELYFMSNRAGGSGGIDLYLTTRSKLRGGGPSAVTN